MPHPSTQAYLDLAAADSETNQSAIARLREALSTLTLVTQHAAAKSEALFHAQEDETDMAIAGLFGEAQDKARTTQRLVAEWQDRTVQLSRHLVAVEDHDARVAAIADAPIADEPVAAPRLSSESTLEELAAAAGITLDELLRRAVERTQEVPAVPVQELK